MTPIPHPMTVLVADDDLFAQRLTITMLRQLGHSGFVVADGARALALLHERSFDVVLLDIAMPVKDGAATLAAIRRAEARERPPRPQCVIMMTAYADADCDQRLRAAGADGVIFKPFNPTQFCRELQNMVGRSPAFSAPQQQESLS